MKRLCMFFLALGMPWLVLLMRNNVASAIIALFMQATIIGWLPATIWALNVNYRMRFQPVKPRPVA